MAINKYIGQDAYELLASELMKIIKTKAEASHTHGADQITETEEKKFVSATEKADWSSRVTSEQLTQAINQLSSGLAWKGVYETLEALRAAITEPKEGYFVIVTKEPTYQNKNTMLIYEAEEVNDWQTLGDIFVPGEATQSSAGLMSAADKTKLDGLQNYTLTPATTAALGGVKAKEGGDITIAGDGTIDIETAKLVAAGERDKWNQAGTDAASALEQIATANGKITALEGTTAQHTQDIATINGEIDALQTKDGEHDEAISAANGKITALEEKVVLLSTEEAQQIIDKYKPQA